MTSDYLKHSRSLEEIYALLDKSRDEAATAAQARFHIDVETAIAAIASLCAIAGARVEADSRVASAGVLINAELAAARLLAEAEVQASRCAEEVMTRPIEVVEAALLEIGERTAASLIALATDSIKKIRQDAEAAMKILADTGAIAIREIQTLGANVVEQTRQAAELAAEKLVEYRKRTHTAEEAVSDATDLAKVVIKAAGHAATTLQETTNTALVEITAVTDRACLAVREVALAAEKKILDGKDRAITGLKETLKVHR